MTRKLKHIFSMRNLIILLALFVIATIASYGYLNNKKATAPVDVVVTSADHYTGPVDSKNVLIEYGDFQCPACAAYHPVVKKVTSENVANLKFVFKNFPLISIHRNAMTGAVAAEAAAKQNKYWEMHDALYENQKAWSEGLDAKTQIMIIAASIGIDTDKLAADMQDEAVIAKVQSDLKEATALGLQSTPSFVLNGKRLDTSSVTSFEAFETLIKKSLIE